MLRLSDLSALAEYGDHLGEAFLAMDQTWRVAALNQTATSLVGLAAAEALGRSFWDVVPGLRGGPLEHALTNAIDRPKPTELEVESPFSSGRVIRAVAMPLAGGLAVSFRDVTRERTSDDERQRRLLSSEEHRSLAAEVASIGTWEVDVRSGARQWSPQFCAILGLPAGTTPDPTLFSSLIDTGDRRRVNDLYRAVYAGEYGGHYSTEFRINRADTGAERWVSTRGRVFFDEQDRASRGIGALIDITDRKRVEQALKESEQRLQATQEHAGIGIAETDQQGRYLRVNEAFCSITGYAREELLSRTCWSVTDPAYVDAERDQYRACVAGQSETYTVEKLFRRKDQVVRWAWLRSATIRGEGGAFSYAVRTLLDITDQKQAESALRGSEERYRLATEAFHGGVSDHDIALGHVTRTARHLELVGESDETLPPTSDAWFDRIHPDDLEQYRAARAPVWEGGASQYEAEYRVRHKNGHWVWIWHRAKAKRGQDGSLQRVVGALLDITKRKHAEQALRESEARFRHMADSVPALIWMNDAHGRLSFVNMHFGHLFGRPPHHLVGQGWRDLVHPSDLPTFQASFVEAFRSRRSFRTEVRVFDREGQLRWLRCESVIRLSDAHDFLGYTGCGVDVTEAKLAQDHQSLLIHELNHRVKNTLATVQSIVSRTLRNVHTAEQARADIEGRLFALSRAHDVLTRENWDSADLREIVKQAVEAFGGKTEGRIEVQGPSIRLAPSRALGMAMALQELATNATKYGALSSGEGQVKIEWALDETTHQLRFVWAEHGGPPVLPPRREGFGSRLIQRTLAQDFSGEVSLAFDPAGVICTVTAAIKPLSENREGWRG